MSGSRSDAWVCGTPSIDTLAQALPSAGQAANQQLWDTFVGGREAMNDTAAEQTRWLARTIETEIIPRLMLAHRSNAITPPALRTTPQASLSEHQVHDFTQLALVSQPQAILAYVSQLRRAGMPLDAIYLDLLAPAARHMGALWEADLCGFAEVTLGLWRLQQVMYELGPAFQESSAFVAQPRRAILVPVPGSQHTMGLFMVAEFFRRSGWDVWGDAMASAKDIVNVARNEWFDLIGFSVSTEAQVDTLASAIAQVRRASHNRGLLVIIGGPIVTTTPGLASLVGADASAEDAPQAVQQAESLLSCRSGTS